MNNRRRTYGVSSSKINEILISTSDSIYKVSESGELTNIHSYSNDTTYNYPPIDMYVADDDTLVVLKRSVNSNDYTYVNTANLNTTISFTNRGGVYKRFITKDFVRSMYTHLHNNKYILFGMDLDCAILSSNGYDNIANRDVITSVDFRYPDGAYPIYVPIQIGSNILGIQDTTASNYYSTKGILINGSSVSIQYFPESVNTEAVVTNYMNFNVWDKNSSYVHSETYNSYSKIVVTKILSSGSFLSFENHEFSVDLGEYYGLYDIVNGDYIIIRRLGYNDDYSYNYKMARIDMSFNLGEWSNFTVPNPLNDNSLVADNFYMIGDRILAVKNNSYDSEYTVSLSTDNGGTFNYIGNLDSKVRCLCPSLSVRKYNELLIPS